MPRELVHWKVIEAAAGHPKLDAHPQLKEALSSSLDLAYLGSFCHDVPYYYRAGLHPFETVADLMHGREGEDTFSPMSALAKQIALLPKERQSSQWAFLFGMLSHMAADVVFHPMIFYFTGNYHDPDPNERKLAQARHRMIEVYLESWVRPQVQFRHGYSISRLMKRIPGSVLRDTYNALDASLTPKALSLGEVDAPLWEAGMKQLAFYQTLFLSPVAGIGIAGLNVLLGQKLRGVEALMSYRRTKPEAFFDSPMEFKNPMTGDSEATSAAKLLQQSIETTVEYILLFAPFLSGEEPVLPWGPSLNYGIPQARAEAATYFSGEGVPLPGLVKNV